MVKVTIESEITLTCDDTYCNNEVKVNGTTTLVGTDTIAGIVDGFATVDHDSEIDSVPGGAAVSFTCFDVPDGWTKRSCYEYCPEHKMPRCGKPMTWGTRHGYCGQDYGHKGGCS